MDFGSCIKYGILFWISTIFAILGIGMILIGAIAGAVLSFNDPTFVEFSFISTPAVVILIGVLIFIMSFMGCVGALKEKYWMIKAFSYLLLILLILEVATACYMYRGDFKDKLENKLNETMLEYGNNTQVQKSWDMMQHEFKCCGLNGSNDWLNIGNKTIPPSCCSEIPFNTETMQAEECAVENAYKSGCFNLVVDAVEKQGFILGLSALGIALIQLFIIMYSCALARSIRRDYTTV